MTVTDKIARHREVSRRSQIALRERRRSEGQCRDCGRPSVEGRLRCSDCLVMAAKVSKTYRERNPEYLRTYHKGRPNRVRTVVKLGLMSESDVTRFLALSNGLCEMCRRPVEKLVVDHDHLTGVVRGLLCHRCNVMLGLSGDDAELLAAAIEYLTTHLIAQ